ncbi:chaperonin GroEL (HSP60 family) (plasmid) [Ensifer sp. WSM1721]|uniref:hypothetical protein n=1 Tax=Ensifer sp. WSM1721 TaxID=1041159 RepID=UPI00047EE1F1|nr:hypothetical protein [Ensifer sp. WSM1721]
MAVIVVNFHCDARDRMLRGGDTLANTVKVTLGPKVEKSFGAPQKDGFTVEANIVVSLSTLWHCNSKARIA